MTATDAPEPIVGVSPLHRRTFWQFFAAFAALTIGWALAGPIVSVADENAHFAKGVAATHGQFTGVKVDGVRHLVVTLPDGYEYDGRLECFIYRADEAADCHGELGVEGGSVGFPSWVSNYNPLYYVVAGWPTIFIDGNGGFYAYRLMSALLSSGFLAAACAVLFSQPGRRWLGVGLVFCASPMVLYMSAAINPQGVEISAGVALWAAMLAVLSPARFDPSKKLPKSVIAVLVTSAIFFVNARSVGPFWLLFVVLVTVLLTSPSRAWQLIKSRAHWPWLAGIVAGCIAAVTWILKTSVISSGSLPGEYPYMGVGPLNGFLIMVRRTGLYVEQASGFFGWLDTPMPGLLLSVYYGAVFLVIALVIAFCNRTGVLRFAAVLVAVVLLPAVMQGITIDKLGLIWQGRYSLFAYIGLLATASWALDKYGAKVALAFERRFTIIVLAAVSFYSVCAFVLVLRRYAVGNDQGIVTAFRNPEWQPPLGTVGVTLLYVAAVAYFGYLILAATRAQAATTPDRD